MGCSSHAGCQRGPRYSLVSTKKFLATNTAVKLQIVLRNILSLHVDPHELLHCPKSFDTSIATVTNQIVGPKTSTFSPSPGHH